MGVAEFLQRPLEESSGLVLAENTLGDETCRIGLAYGRLLLDTLGLERLCIGSLVLLVVAKPSVTDKVDDDVVAELCAVGEGEPDSRKGTPHLPSFTPLEGPIDLHSLEKRHILTVLDSVAGDKTRAAALLGVSRRTLERRVAEWGSA